VSSTTIPAIIPIVLFTGNRPWSTKRDLADLIDSPAALPWVIPHWPILYLSLADYSAEELLDSKKAWHKALAVVRCEREKSLEAFSRVLARAAQQIDKLADTDEVRHWRLLEFILRWAAARRATEQHEALFRAVLSNVRPEHREQILIMSSKIQLTFEEAYLQKAKESYAAGITEGIAEGIAEGETNACQALLLRLLEKRFGSVPTELSERIRITDDVEHLRSCCEQVLDISSIDEFTL
jgi:hypothetical protein